MHPSASALARLKASRQKHQHQQVDASSTAGAVLPIAAAGQHAAASSDAANEAYMQRFEEAFATLSATDSAQQEGPHLQQQQQQPDDMQKTEQLMPHARYGPGQLSGTEGVPRKQQQAARRKCVPSTMHAAAAAAAAHAVTQDVAPASCAGEAGSIAQGWRRGPADPAGVVLSVCERPVLCSAAMADGSGDVVLGSSDHALYVVGRTRRTLYSKTKGHTEWVTCVCSLPGGRVLSGGMDGKLWLWPAAGVAGSEVAAAHAAPVSKVALLSPQAPAAPAAAAAARCSSASSGRGGVSGSSSSRRHVAAAAAAVAGPVLAASCSYDKTVKVWDVTSARARKLVAMQGHAGPVLELAVAPGGSALLTGDRKGSLMCWDVAAAASSWGTAVAHEGHVTALAWLPNDASSQEEALVALSGGQDGNLRAWDGRQAGCIAQQPLHASSQGAGAIGGIVTVACSTRALVVTAGADQTLRVSDPATGFRALHTLPLPDFPYSLAAVPCNTGLVVCGCGDGSVHVVDAVRGCGLFVLRGGAAAVRCLEVGADSLVASGDDGCVTRFTFV